MTLTLDNAPIQAPRWSLVKQRADDLSKDYSFPPIPVLEIAERAGVDVAFVSFNEFSDDVAGFCDFAKKRLYVNVSDAPNRQTFTMAHELGHWMLHREYYISHPEKYAIMPRYGVPDNNDPFERESNHFAANLLVPTRLLRPVINAHITQLAQMFGVSRQMMEFRVKNVG